MLSETMTFEHTALKISSLMSRRAGDEYGNHKQFHGNMLMHSKEWDRRQNVSQSTYLITWPRCDLDLDLDLKL